MSHAQNPFTLWFMEAGVTSPEAWQVEGGRDMDVPLPDDDRAVWAQFYGEAPRESVYEGTKGTLLIGHIHFEDYRAYESYLLTLEGFVIRTVTDKETGLLIEGPKEATFDQQNAVIELLDPHYFPQD